MPRSLTPRDAHALINEVCKQATGQEPEVRAVDTSTFVSVGEKILATGVENTLNSLSIVLGRTIVAVRPYTSKFRIIEETDTELYKNRVRKISYYSRYALASGDWNTQLYTNLADGFDNGENPESGTPRSTKSMWVQNRPEVLELNFAGQSVWQDSTTVYRDQLKVAFTDETSFNSFVAGIMTEKANDIEVQREAFRRTAVVNHIAGVYAMRETYPSMCVNLTSAYNSKFGTSFTSEQLRTSQLKSFLEFLVSTIKQYSRRLEYRSADFHIPYTKTVNDIEYNILRHTPRDRQRLLMYSPLLIDAEAQVMPEIFNDNYLKIDNYEAVDFWMSFDNPATVSAKPAIPGTDGQTAPDEAVTIPFVVACLYDQDALMINNYLEDSLASPVEARKRYYNLWWTFCANICSDYSENFVLFYMEDGDTPTPPTPGTQTTVTPNSFTFTEDAQSLTATVANAPEGAVDVAIIGAPALTDYVSLNYTNDVVTLTSDGFDSTYNGDYVGALVFQDADELPLAFVEVNITVNIPEG